MLYCSPFRYEKNNIDPILFYFYSLELEGEWLCEGIMRALILLSYDKVLCFLVRLFNPLLTAAASSYRKKLGKMKYSLGELREESRVLSLIFSHANIAYHTSRKRASNLAGPVRKQRNDMLFPAQIPSFSFWCCNSLSIISILKVHHREERWQVIPIPSDWNDPLQEYSISAFGKQHRAVRTNREKRWMPQTRGATQNKRLDSFLVI